LGEPIPGIFETLSRTAVGTFEVRKNIVSMYFLLSLNIALGMNA